MPSSDACQGDGVINQNQAGTKGALPRFHPVFLAQQMQWKNIRKMGREKMEKGLAEAQVWNIEGIHPSHSLSFDVHLDCAVILS